ncbi:MAG: hypothetical protein OQK07_02755 [Rhodospirillales bacterium]|nr:hypothetical protein [Rhodospirillales bacterium]
MIDSPVRPAMSLRGLVLTTVLAAAFFAVPASKAIAQADGRPLRLAPPQQLAPPIEGAQPSAGETRNAPVTATPVRPMDRPDDVQVDKLETIDPDSVGTLDAGLGGFGADMWRGLDRAIVEAHLSHLPAKVTSPAQRDLMRRLLLSSAAVPAGAGGPKGSLLAIRIERLAAMGDVASVSALLRASPARSQDPALLRIEVDTMFLANDFSRACGLVESRIGEDPSPYWQKANIFCQVLQGNSAMASLGAGLLREQGINDPVFFVLVDALSGHGEVVIESLSAPEPLHLAMARTAKVTLPTDATWSDDPGVLRSIAVSPALVPAVRIEAAEKAEAVGALPTDTLRQIYASVAFTDEELASPLTVAAESRGAIGRALLYRTAMAQTVPTALAEVVSRALSMARASDRYVPVARAFADIIRRIEPTNELIWFAGEAARALLVADDRPAAGNWVNALRRGASFNEEAAEALTRILPLARMMSAHAVPEWNDKRAEDWWALQKRDALAAAAAPQSSGGESAARSGSMASEAVRRATRLFVLIEAFGDPIADSLWRDLSVFADVQAHNPTPVAMKKALARAGGAERVGETVLLTLSGLGEGGLVQADPAFVEQVLDSLQRIGLVEESRRLALEAAVAAGL